MNYHANNINANKGCCRSEECGTYVTIQGLAGPMGLQGEQGIQGEKGDNVETPIITISENTPH